eukprot:CAMPEP_0174824268 /NCGR_PEP_ID=MMETSP1107-20130205/32437_1 /TAXON_ID=36770 /ORGANISM="Paraphysomonas vestita, Strain GFlagA" /LENGTH=387 /DNA_ID=CAMNT_0016050707 /DNA_START=190 /DNA_END=1353 /DNA_ORIENTATION=+
MKLSGNGNARSFFLQHGVPASQMTSEKKYKTKAAQEYRRHLAKLVEHETHPDGHHHHDTQDHHHEDQSTKELTNNIDSLLLSVSQQPKLDRAVTDSAVTYNNNGNNITHVNPPTPPQIETSETPTKVASTVTPIGTLSIQAAIASETEEKEETETNHQHAVLTLKPKKVTSTKKKTLGAKKLTVPSDSGKGSQDVKIETFESVEKKQQRALAEQEDFELAQKLQQEELSKSNSNGGGESRIAALLHEEGQNAFRTPAATTSIYQPLPSTSSPTTKVSVTSPYASLTSNNYSSSSTTSSSSNANSGNLNKYANAKGISSDQYFGREQAENEEYRRNISKYSNSSSISSDMLYGREDAHTSTREQDNLSVGLDFDRLKDSVKGFFDEFR